MFNTSISKLISTGKSRKLSKAYFFCIMVTDTDISFSFVVALKDVESSKVAFVSSASAFEKWTALTGLNGVLKGI